MNMIPGPCPMCGGPATYDGIEHEVMCDKPSCEHYFQDKGIGHEAVIRRWNQLPAQEVRLAIQRAEAAESDLARMKERADQLTEELDEAHNEAQTDYLEQYSIAIACAAALRMMPHSSVCAYSLDPTKGCDCPKNVLAKIEAKP